MNKPEMNGAVDLGALKNAPTDEQRDMAVAQAMSELGLLCDCGNLIERGGQEVIFAVTGLMPSPRGPVPGMNVQRRSFCSATCEHFAAFERAATNAGEALFVVSRPLPTVRWIKQPRPSQEAV